jgi:hypothetical protein
MSRLFGVSLAWFSPTLHPRDLDDGELLAA